MTVLIWAGGIGFAAAIVTDFIVLDHTLAGSLTWICLALLPVYLVAVWLARRRPRVRVEGRHAVPGAVPLPPPAPSDRVGAGDAADEQFEPVGAPR